MRRAIAASLVVFLVACADSGGDPVDRATDDDRAPAGAAEPAAAADTTTPAPADDADATGSNDGTAAATIPERFRGEWNAEPSACGTGASETRLRIEADRIRFYESVGVVRDVVLESDRVAVVTAEYTGEGDTWQDERRLTLSADGESLTVSGGGDLVRHRCS